MHRFHIVADAQCVHSLGYAVDDFLIAESCADDFLAGNAVQDRNDRRLRSDLVAGGFDCFIQLGPLHRQNDQVCRFQTGIRFVDVLEIAWLSVEGNALFLVARHPLFVDDDAHAVLSDGFREMIAVEDP